MDGGSSDDPDFLELCGCAWPRRRSRPLPSPPSNSAYTDIDLDQCTIIETSDFGTVWACAGHKGYPVRIAEGDLRFFVSYGFGADDEPAAGQTPPPFNTLGPKIEWRLSNASGAWKPVATIVRYFVDNDDATSMARSSS